MDDKKIIEQIVQDFRQHSSGESRLRDELAARVADLESELAAWDNLGLNFEKRIRGLNYTLAEYKIVLRQIMQPPNEAGDYALSRADCALLAKDVLRRGEEYEKESKAQ